VIGLGDIESAFLIILIIIFIISWKSHLRDGFWGSCSSLKWTKIHFLDILRALLEYEKIILFGGNQGMDPQD